jgi:hypothetical protein
MLRGIPAILYKLDEKNCQQGICFLTIEHPKPEDGQAFSLRELQGFIDGYMEIVGRIEIDKNYYIIIVDEEGLLKRKPINHGFWWNYGTKEGTHRYVGNVLLIREDLLE